MKSAAYGILGQREIIDDSNMGFTPLQTKDIQLEPALARAQHQSMSIFNEPLEENIRKYEDLIECCQAAGCDVTLVYTPVSHAKVWQLYDQDAFYSWACDLADKYDVPLFDFNLLKDRYTLFSDRTSFSDDNHLSGEGAELFSGAMADVLARYRSGEDVSPMFYADYKEAIHESSYWGRNPE